jgi:hypothetical protein
VFDASPTVDELSRLRDMAERHGLTIDMTDSVHCVRNYGGRDRSDADGHLESFAFA